MPPVPPDVRTPAAALCLAATLAAAAPAHAAPQRLGDSSPFPTPVATTPSGRSVVVLTDDDRSRLLVRIARAGRRFGQPREVPSSRSRPGRRDPRDVQVTAGDDGRALITWTTFDESREAEPFERDEGCCRRLRAVVMHPSGRFGRPTLFAGPNDGGPYTVATVRGRRAAVAFADARETRVTVAGPDGRFGRTLRLAAGDGLLLAVRLAPAGPRVVTFEPASGVVELRGTTGRRALAAFGTDGYLLGRAASPSGHLLLAQLAEPDLSQSRQVRVAHGLAGARLRHSVLRFGEPVSADAAIAPDGSGLLVVDRYDRATGIEVVAVSRSGRPGWPRSLRGVTAPTPDLAFAAGRGGTAVIAGEGRIAGRTALVAWRLRPGRRTAREVVSSSAGRPAVTLDRQGRAVVVFARRGAVYAQRLRP